MEKQPFFTIGIPVYNVEKYVAACLDRVLGQSFGDFEVILVDDGSPDRSIDIISEYASVDSRIRIIRKPNCGVAAARNTMLYNAQGRYLYFIDSDDTMCEGALENAYNHIVKENYPDILQAGYRKLLGDRVIEYPMEYPGDKYFAEGITKDDRLMMLCADKKLKDQIYTRFVKTEFLKLAGISFITSYNAQEDNEFTFNLYRRAETIAFANFFTCNYYKSREGSISTEGSCRSIAGVFNRWHSFYYADYRYYNLTQPGKAAFEKEKNSFLTQIRYGIIGLPLYRTESEIETLVSMLENYFEKDIRKLPVGSTGHAPVYLMYKLIGIRKAVALLKIAVKITGKNKKAKG